ncbi:hypothetical protein Q9L58_001479 [Maublancomyces gigas]|uniref:Uncharacterized protein n=1 Tax=Discina gigas TaxID=1032678 RepID=A0ABR3GU48_9PEZI
MHNHRRKHSSFSSEISNLTIIATCMVHNKGKAKGKLRPAIKILVASTHRMSGIHRKKKLGHKRGRKASTDDDGDSSDDDDSPNDSESSDDSDDTKPETKKTQSKKTSPCIRKPDVSTPKRGAAKPATSSSRRGREIA